jgi:hypothetical protein
MMQKLPMLNNCTLQNNSSLTDCNRLPTKPTPALTLSTKLNDFDLPTYATTVYPNLPDSTFSDSTLSLSSNISSDSSVLTLDDSMTTQEYYQGNASIAKFSQVHYKPNPKKENICTDSNDYNYTFQPENESYLFPLPPVHN